MLGFVTLGLLILFLSVSYFEPRRQHTGLVEALQAISGDTPNNPDILQQDIDVVKRAAIAGTTGNLKPDDVEQARIGVQNRASNAHQEFKTKWVAADNHLAELAILANYQAITALTPNSVPLKDLDISAFDLEQGMLTINSRSEVIENEAVLSLLERSARKTAGIDRMVILRGSARVADFTLR